jgi:hypothetical protein
MLAIMILEMTAFFLAVVVAGVVAQGQGIATIAPTSPCGGDALKKCFDDNECESSCPAAMERESPIPMVYSPVQEAIKAAHQEFLTGECDYMKTNICHSKDCCSACTEQMETFASCYMDVLLAQLTQAHVDLNAAAAAGTPTLVPTVDPSFINEGWSCDMADPCSTSTVASPAGSTPAVPGSTPAGPTPFSGATHISYVFAAVAAVAVMLSI